MRTAQTLRAFTGLALLSRGFRPFFLGAGVFALAAIAIWPAVFTGTLALPTAFSAIDWHTHEMLFGYGSAVIAGFLLTAIPNWTGRLPVAGATLGSLALLWLLGRCAVLVSGLIGWAVAATVDVAFLAVFTAVVAREIIAARNTRNLKVAAVVLLLALANLGFHLEARLTGTAEHAARAALALIVFLILLFGGRVVPSFTGNWLAKRGEARRPAPADRWDTAALVVSGVGLSGWVAVPDARITGAALLAGGAANLWRLGRWRGWRTFPDPLVLVLHAAFLLVALGFLAAGASCFRAILPVDLPVAVGIHVWAIGGIGGMTLAMMTRATLGHVGHALVASTGTRAIYLLVAVALAARVSMALLPSWGAQLMLAAATAWCMAFAGFLAIYGPMLTRRS
ncbi:NnrS family protein [Xanthobacter oligotrophicus]|uniref:NnrS family protein n=1 Tax=Xanthobacter oligotrophicus TaxID=2607286 RepID=UPI0011F3ECF3|nr:NnrS family protein [Xanthobacter oligotrophicus]MCG5234838.1 NnrS family protein [Xanthobacter oligotrophicus]